jgi:hypothetical protein
MTYRLSSSGIDAKVPINSQQSTLEDIFPHEYKLQVSYVVFLTQ